MKSSLENLYVDTGTSRVKLKFDAHILLEIYAYRSEKNKHKHKQNKKAKKTLKLLHDLFTDQ